MLYLLLCRQMNVFYLCHSHRYTKYVPLWVSWCLLCSDHLNTTYDTVMWQNVLNVLNQTEKHLQFKSSWYISIISTYMSAFSINVFKVKLTVDCIVCGKCCSFINVFYSYHTHKQGQSSVGSVFGTFSDNGGHCGALSDLEWRQEWPLRTHVLQTRSGS